MVVHFQNFPKSSAVATDHRAVPADSDTSRGPLAGLYRQFFKRFIDISFVILSLPVSLPLVAIMALLVALDGTSPFYTQARVGRGGRIFRMLKIRSMVPDADNQLAAYLEKNPLARQEWDETQKLKSDPRITRIGRILRKSSLDELPQLWNVLKGDMSIVGPRPMMVEQQELYPGRAYYALRPGITGPWQVSDRNEGSFAGRAVFDAKYHADLSIATDLSILLRTVAVVVRSTGY